MSNAVLAWEPAALDLMVSWTFAATLLFVFAALLVVCSREASASLRHAVWAAAAIVALALPAAGLLAPRHAGGAAVQLATYLDLPYISGSGSRPTVSQTAARGASTQQILAGSGGAARESGEFALASRSDAAPAPLLMIWALGTLLALGCLASGYYRSHRLATQSVAIADPVLKRRFFAAKDALGEHRAVELRMSPTLAAPVAFGTLRPSVLVPIDFATWPDSEQYAALVHELAHVRRRDCAVQTLVQLSRAILWPSPLVWYAARRNRIEQEKACDDIVLAAGVSAPVYARVLLNVVERIRAVARPPLVTQAFATRSNLESRIHAVLDNTRARRTPPAHTAVAALMLLALAAPLGALVATPSLREENAPTSGSDVAPASARAATVDAPVPQRTELDRAQRESLPPARGVEHSGVGFLVSRSDAPSHRAAASGASTRAAGGDSLRSERLRRIGEEFMRFHRERIRAHGLDAVINNPELYAWFVQEEWRAAVVRAGVASMPRERDSWSADQVRSDISARVADMTIKSVLVLEIPLGDGALANVALVTIPRSTDRR